MTEIIRIPASMGNLYGILRTQSSALLILSHGFGGSHTNHQDYADFFFSKGMSVFNLDFCGGGLESKSDGSMLEMTVLTEAEDLRAVINHFKNDPRFTKLFLMGFSQGGFVSSYVAAKRPEDVAGLVLEFPAYVLQDRRLVVCTTRRQSPSTSTMSSKTILETRSSCMGITTRSSL